MSGWLNNVKAEVHQCRPCTEPYANCQKIRRPSSLLMIRIIAAGDFWDRTVLRREQQYDEFGPILQEVEAGKRLGWKNIVEEKATRAEQFAVCFSWFLLSLQFDPEDGGNMFIRNVGFSPNYTVLQPRRPYSFYCINNLFTEEPCSYYGFRN